MGGILLLLVHGAFLTRKKDNMKATAWGIVFVMVWIMAQNPVHGQRIHELQSDHVSAGNSSAPDVRNGPDLEQVKERIFILTNAFRGQEKRSPLKVNAKLAAAAQKFADFMARTDIFSHTADDKEPWQRTTEAGYKHCITDKGFQLDSE